MRRMDSAARLFDRFRTQGDLQALGEVFEATAPRLLAIAVHLLGNVADAEDAVQQTFLLAIDRAGAFDAERALEPWLGGLLQNVVRNAGRRARRRRAEVLPEITSDELGPMAIAEREELIARLRERVDALPAEQRQVIRLRLQHGLSPAQIAEALELAPGTVRMRLHRGLETLRRHLPAGLAALLVAMLPARGLAAVKQAVLTNAKAQVLVAAGAAAAGAAGLTTLTGILAMKKLVSVLSIVLALGVWWWLEQGDAPLQQSAPHSEEPAITPRSAIAAASGANETAPAPREVLPAPVTPTPEREPTPDEIFGRVVDAVTKAPIEGAEVELFHRPADEFWNLDLAWGERSERLAEARSDAQGAFSFDVARARPHRIRVRAGGYASATELGRMGGSVVVIELARGATVHGVVRYDGKPASGVELRVAVYGESLELAQGQSDGGGGFRFVDLPARDLLVQLRSPRFEEVWRRVSPRAGEVHELTIDLAAGAELRGRVVDKASGAPIADALVSDSWTKRRTVRSDRDGHFVLAGLRDEGFVMLHVEALGFASWSRNVGGALALEHQVQLERGAELSGRLVDAQGAPITSALVVVNAEVDEAPGISGADWLRAELGPDGRFAVRGLRPELHYSLMARARGHGTRVYVLPRPFASGERHDLGEVVLRSAGGAEGLVVDEDGQPVPDATLEVRGENRDFAAWSNGAVQLRPPIQFTSRSVKANSRGVFRITDLAGGRYELAASLEGIDPGQPLAVAVEDGVLLEGLRVVLVRGRSLRGVVVREDGLPLDAQQCEQLRLQAVDPTHKTASARLAADGSFEILGLGTGPCRIGALLAPAGFALPTQVIEAGTSGLRLVLERSSQLTGQVVDERGNGVRATVLVFEDQGLDSSLHHQTDDEGRFRIEVARSFVGKVAAQRGGEMLLGAELKDVRAGREDLRLVLGSTGR
jgi:RNA polymerase sigma-70 factor (ECF subfamily)